MSESIRDDQYIVVVTGTVFTVYKNRLENTNVSLDLVDECVTAAAFSENNDVLFLGTSKGNIRFVYL
jgi:hypothetical protein